MKLIPLTKGKFAVVDDDDYDAISSSKWNASPTHLGTFYAARSEKQENGKYSTVLMHRIINRTPKGMQTDHINGDTLDNRKKNLRSVTPRQNAQNSAPNRRREYSAHKGVTWHKRDRRWVAKIVVDSRPIHLGYFTDELEAAAAYASAAARHFGPFARTQSGDRH
ncbi:HNH endonuclease [Sphingopyxis sp. 550A]